MSDKLVDLVVAAARGDLPAVKRLARQVKNVNVSDKLGDTDLVQAALNGRLPVVQWLVREARANVDGQTTIGLSALYVAAQEGEAEVVQFLVSAGAAVDVMDDCGSTPLNMAAEMNQAAAARLLIYSTHALVRMLLRGDAPDNQLARDTICYNHEAKKANAPAVRAHFDEAECWEREREAAMRNGVVVRSRRRSPHAASAATHLRCHSRAPAKQLKEEKYE